MDYFWTLMHFMNDPIFAAPHRQEGFALEKQKLLEDCRQWANHSSSLQNGDVFKTWTDVFVAAKTTAGNKSMTSNQSSWHEWKPGRIVWLWHIQFAGYLLGPASATATLSSCAPNVKLQYAMKLSKSCWLHFFIRYFTALHWLMSGKRPDVQVPKKERSWVGATWQLLQFPCGQWVWMDLNHLKVLPAWISYLKLSAHPNLIYLCSHDMPSLWRRRLALISAQERSAQEALQHREQIQQQVNVLGCAVVIVMGAGSGSVWEDCRAQNDSIHLMKVQGSLREQSTCDPHGSVGRGAIPPFNKKDP